MANIDRGVVFFVVAGELFEGKGEVPKGAGTPGFGAFNPDPAAPVSSPVGVWDVVEIPMEGGAFAKGFGLLRGEADKEPVCEDAGCESALPNWALGLMALFSLVAVDALFS